MPRNIKIVIYDVIHIGILLYATVIKKGEKKLKVSRYYESQLAYSKLLEKVIRS